jgi:hypothetical protein
MRLVGRGEGFVVFQSTVQVISWGALVIAIGLHLRNGMARVLSTALILGFASSNAVTLWNASVLSESLAVSELVLFISGILWMQRSSGRAPEFLAVMSALCFAATRDSDVPTVALFALGFFVLGRHYFRTNSRRHGSWNRLSRILLVVALSSGFFLAISGRSSSNIEDVYAVRIFPYPARVDWFAAHGMPQSIKIDALAHATLSSCPGCSKTVFALSTKGFSQLDHWFDSQGNTTYFLYLLTHPAYDFEAPLVRPEMAFNFAGGNLYFYRATGWISSPFSGFFWPSLSGLALTAAVLLIISALRRTWRHDTWWVQISFAIIGALAMFISWHGDGQETTRHTLEGLVELRLGIWLALVLTLFGKVPGESSDAYEQRRIKTETISARHYRSVIFNFPFRLFDRVNNEHPIRDATIATGFKKGLQP